MMGVGGESIGVWVDDSQVFTFVSNKIDLPLYVLYAGLLYELNWRQALVVCFSFTQRFVDGFSLTIPENEDNNSEFLSQKGRGLINENRRMHFKRKGHVLL